MTVDKSGAPPVRIVRTGEQLLISVAVVCIVVDGHFHVDQVVVIRTVVMGGRQHRGAGFTRVNADLAADEQEAVLALPALDHPLQIIVIEAGTPRIVIHDHRCGRPVVDRVEAEVSLPRIVVHIIELTVGIPQVGNHAAGSHRFLSADGADRTGIAGRSGLRRGRFGRGGLGRRFGRGGLGGCLGRGGRGGLGRRRSVPERCLGRRGLLLCGGRGLLRGSGGLLCGSRIRLCGSRRGGRLAVRRRSLRLLLVFHRLEDLRDDVRGRVFRGRDGEHVCLLGHAHGCFRGVGGLFFKRLHREGCSRNGYDSHDRTGYNSVSCCFGHASQSFLCVLKNKLFGCKSGGDGGNRNRVRKLILATFYERSP